MTFRLTAVPKPERGTARAERQAKRTQTKASERDEKAKVRKRDGAACKGYCRFPGCKVRTYLEVSHLVHKGMGGDKQNIRSVAELMWLACQSHHRGSFSVDSGDIEVRPLTPLGTNGPCEFWIAASTLNNDGVRVRRFVRFAYETSIGVYRKDQESRL